MSDVADSSETSADRRALPVVSFDGTALHAVELGPHDGPLVVLCHGVGLSAATWGPVPELLAGRHRVILYDLRGHGASADAPGGDYRVRAHARDLTAVLAAAGATASASAVVAGHSLGGGIILAHGRLPDADRLRGAAFVGTSGAAKTLPWLPPRRARAPMARAERTAWLGALRLLTGAARTLGGADRLSLPLVRRLSFGPDAPPHAVRRVRDDLLTARPAALTRTLRGAAAVDPAGSARAFRVRALLLAADDDRIAGSDETGALARALPEGRLVRLSHGGHFVTYTRPDAVATHIARFVAELDAE